MKKDLSKAFGVGSAVGAPAAPKAKGAGGGGAGTVGGLPFATSSGTPKTPTPATGNRNFNRESRSQAVPAGQPPASADASAQNRPQGGPRGAAERVAERSIPADGMTDTIPGGVPAWRAGTGSVGNPRRPFKV